LLEVFPSNYLTKRFIQFLSSTGMFVVIFELSLPCTVIVEACIGFAWQGFGSRGATGVAPVRSCQKIPPWLTEPVPADVKMDPPLTKAEPISDGGSTSVIIYLRRGKNYCALAAIREE